MTTLSGEATLSKLPALPWKGLCKYRRLSLSRSPRDFLKYFEISVPRHIRFTELRNKSIEQPHFTNEYVI